MPATKSVPFFDCEYELGGDEMGFLRESNDVLDDVEALRARMADDGYLLIRGLQKRKKVETARRAILEKLDAAEMVDRSHRHLALMGDIQQTLDLIAAARGMARDE